MTAHGVNNTILTLIDKAPVVDEPYINKKPESIKPLKDARYELVSVLMSPWLKRERFRKKELLRDIRVMDISREQRKKITAYVNDYIFFCGKLVWREEDIPILQECLKAILGITEPEFAHIVSLDSADYFRQFISRKLNCFEENEIIEVCNVLTKVVK